VSQKKSTNTGNQSTSKPPETYVLWNARHSELFVDGNDAIWHTSNLALAKLQRWQLIHHGNGAWEVKRMDEKGLLESVNED
jgi:hypothetical protein